MLKAMLYQPLTEVLTDMEYVAFYCLGYSLQQAKQWHGLKRVLYCMYTEKQQVSTSTNMQVCVCVSISM